MEGSEKLGVAGAAQRLLWAFERRQRDRKGALNDPIVVRIRRELSLAALRRALAAVVERHDALRTRMLWQPPRLLRVVSGDFRPELECVDLSAEPDSNQAVERELASELSRDIPATDWPLRAKLWHLAADDHVLCLNLHHNATDFSSNQILRRDLAWLYRTYCGEPLPPLEPIAWGYADWSDWQARELEEPGRTRLVEYWKRQLSGAREPQFPVSAHGSGGAGRVTGYESAALGVGVFEALSVLARAERTSVFSVFLATFYIALCRHTGQRDLTVTSLLSERDRPELRSTVGCLVTAVPLRTAFSPTGSFLDLLSACRRTLFGAIQHQCMPFHLLPAGARGADFRLDAVALQLMGDRTVVPEPFEAWHFRPDFGGGRTFELEVVVQPICGSYHLNVLYDRRRFDEAFVRELTLDIRDAAAAVAAAPGVSLVDLLDGQREGRDSAPHANGQLVQRA